MTATPILLAAAWAALPAPPEGPGTPAIVESGFVFESPPTPSCHASTIVETRAGFLAAWFGGTAEKNPDVVIYVARREGGRWSRRPRWPTASRPTAGGSPAGTPSCTRPKDGPILLFSKVGPSPDRWWGVLQTSVDDGRTWSEPRRLPDGILGPIKNKPIALPDGSLLCPSSAEDEKLGWRVFLERTPDLGRTW